MLKETKELRRARSRQKAAIFRARLENRRPRIFKIFSFTEYLLESNGYSLEECIVTSRIGRLQKDKILKIRERERYHKSKADRPVNVPAPAREVLQQEREAELERVNNEIARMYFAKVNAAQDKPSGEEHLRKIRNKNKAKEGPLSKMELKIQERKQLCKDKVQSLLNTHRG